MLDAKRRARNEAWLCPTRHRAPVKAQRASVHRSVFATSGRSQCRAWRAAQNAACAFRSRGRCASQAYLHAGAGVRRRA
eukprot:4628366-Pleurochrysis_carterae.AAC.3